MKALRFERDKRLKEYDWMTLRAASGGVPLTDEWKAYLQELGICRDETPQISNGSLVGITWPTIPGEATETAGVTTTILHNKNIVILYMYTQTIDNINVYYVYS